MLFYHFTSKEALDEICEEGLKFGDVWINPIESYNGVWLTTDKSPSGHGLCGERLLTNGEKKVYKRDYGRAAPQDAYFANKLAIRITVKIPKNDRNLVRWRTWGKEHIAVDLDWYKRLNEETPGGKYKTWFIYFGQIPPDWFVAIDDLEPDFVPLSQFKECHPND